MSDDVTRDEVLPRGTIVEFCDLRGRADLNGQTGIVKEFNADKSRYAVCIEAGSDDDRSVEDMQRALREPVLVKRANLKVVSDGDAPERFHDVAARRERRADETAARNAQAPPPADVRFHQPVTISGLKSKPELNGTVAAVIGWNAAKARLMVHTSDGAELSLKPENCLPGAAFPDFGGDDLLANWPVLANGDSDFGQCAICMDNKLGLISPFFSCCFQSMCNDCAVAYADLGKSECPFCRAPFADGEEIADLFRAQCMKGDPRAFHGLAATRQAVGELGAPEFECIARDAALVSRGYAESLMVFGRRCGQAGFLAEGVEHLQRAAEMGLAEAQFWLGYAYEDGSAVARDYSEAVRWYSSGAALGDGQCANGLAVMHFHGKGVVQSYAEAVRWYRVAADAGVTRAMGSLAQCLQSGSGCAKDEAECWKWLHTAAHLGDEIAQTMCEQSGLGDWRSPPPPGFMPNKLSFAERQKLKFNIGGAVGGELFD